MKRSLILLHLWSRCGLEPELHLGVRRDPTEVFQAHAWVSARLADGREIVSGRSGYESAFAFPAAARAEGLPLEPTEAP